MISSARRLDSRVGDAGDRLGKPDNDRFLPLVGGGVYVRQIKVKACG
jgi:hypothetical protein